MRTLAVDLGALLAATVARDEGLLGSYLDLAEGGLMRLYDPALSGRSNEALEAMLDEDPDRFAKVPLYTREYRLMAEFVDRVEDDEIARQLDAALSGREAFRRFDAVLAAFPEEKAAWEHFHEDALLRWVLAWLRSLDIHPLGLEPPPQLPHETPWLVRLALASDGERVVSCDSEEEAVRVFVQIVRELCELRREPVRTRSLRQETRFAREGIEVRREGCAVRLRAT